MRLFPEQTDYKRLPTRGVQVGDLIIGNGHPIRLQTMTTADTMDLEATVRETIRCIEAGAELVRITAPSKKEAENLAAIKSALREAGFHTPLVADIHYTPNAAEIAARLIEKVRINPGNYVDKKKFETLQYTDSEYAAEIERIQKRFTPLVRICKEYGTAMRIGTNHGSLSDRIMSRYGDTAMGMVESAMEFLRIARYESYHNIVLSMKSSNPQVMVQAYRLLVQSMLDEFGECYPLHLGVTEAGDGDEGRIKSAAGMGTLLEDGIGDTVRVSLTEPPEDEIPVCRNLVGPYPLAVQAEDFYSSEQALKLLSGFNPSYQRSLKRATGNIGGEQVPVVIADLHQQKITQASQLQPIGYHYNATLDKWSISDTAADYLWLDQEELPFALPGTLKVLLPPERWLKVEDKSKYFPLFPAESFKSTVSESPLNFVLINLDQGWEALRETLLALRDDTTVVFCLQTAAERAVKRLRFVFRFLQQESFQQPTLLFLNSPEADQEKQLLHFSTTAGALLLEGYSDGLCLMHTATLLQQNQSENRDPEQVANRYETVTPSEKDDSMKMADHSLNHQDLSHAGFYNQTAFSILQASRVRISKTEYISCPSCGRTLFDLQETTAKIRAVTHHLKGVKIAIMGCIVNGPGEMADADFGYVGSGVGTITLYKGKEVVKRGVPSAIAVEELINLLKESGVWVTPETPALS